MGNVLRKGEVGEAAWLWCSMSGIPKPAPALPLPIQTIKYKTFKIKYKQFNVSI